jgi:multicomponent Na+:H+ antiporter subunit E
MAVFMAAFILWCLLVWPYSKAAGWDFQSILAGVAVSAGTALIFREALALHPGRFLNPRRWFWLLCYVPVFVYYCVKANVQVVYLVLHPAMPIKPGIVKVHTKLRSPAGITALANSITLTPGTMTVDATEDGEMYIHWISVKAPEEREATQEIAAPFEAFLQRIIE